MQQLLAHHASSGRSPAPAGTCSAGGAGFDSAGACQAAAEGSSRASGSSRGSGSSKSSGTSSDPAPVLVSGAGHDAMVFADVTRMSMLFVRCRWVPKQ